MARLGHERACWRRLDTDGRPLDVEAGLCKLPPAAAARGDVDVLRLFGSYGTDRQTPLSDVDVACCRRPARLNATFGAACIRRTK